MKNKLLSFGVTMLVLLNLASFLYGQSNARQVNDLKVIVSQIPKDPIVYVGKDGVTPKKGIDYRDGANGADGINAISFNRTVVKEVPLIGQTGAPGLNGKDAPELQSNFDNKTGNFEQKYSDDTVWQVVIPCEKFVSGCVNQQGSTPAGESGGLDSN